METEKLYLFSEDFRYGRITYFFMATDSQLEKVVGFGFSAWDEVGKHSEVSYVLGDSNLTLIDLPYDDALKIYNNPVTPTRDIEDMIDCVEELEELVEEMEE